MLRAVTSSLGPNTSWAPGVSAETLHRVERAGGSLATRSVALMDERLPWFRSLPAQQRSWVTLVAQAGISGYVVWARSPGTEYRITGEVFGTAPRDLVRAVSLRRTVELVRIAILVAEEDLPALAADEAETDRPARFPAAVQPGDRLRRGVGLRSGRRDPRRLGRPGRGRGGRRHRPRRGLRLAVLPGRRAGLGSRPPTRWSSPGRRRPVTAPTRSPPSPNGRPRSAGRRCPACTATDWCSCWPAATAPGPEIESLFGDGPVVRGRPGAGLREAAVSAADALAGLDVAAAWPARAAHHRRRRSAGRTGAGR